MGKIWGLVLVAVALAGCVEPEWAWYGPSYSGLTTVGGSTYSTTCYQVSCGVTRLRR